MDTLIDPRVIETLVVLNLVVFLLVGLVLLSKSLSRLWAQRKLSRLQMMLWQTNLEKGRQQLEVLETAGFSWNGFRTFLITRKEDEGEHICSFYLTAHDRKPLPTFQAGQYLTFQCQVPGHQKPLIRCYSLSDCPDRQGYRVTIKKILPVNGDTKSKPGLVSSYFHDQLQAGDMVEALAPRGNFVLPENLTRSSVFIAAGIGITPFLSMLNTMIKNGAQENSETWLFYGVTNSIAQVQKEYLQECARKYSGFKLVVGYSKPLANDVPGKDFEHHGRIDFELLQSRLPSNNFDFYLCGPNPMIKQVADQLREWGVPESQIFYEAFSAVQVQAMESQGLAGSGTPPSEVSFHRSGKTVQWTTEKGTLLDLAEDNGIFLDCGCRVGNCGTCAVAVRKGSARPLNATGAVPADGSCLMCISIPETDIELDA